MKNQKPRTLDEQLSTLKNRGMHFLNEQLAKEFLNRINYFRLKYFWIGMLDMESGDFKKDIYFEDVIGRYNSGTKPYFQGLYRIKYYLTKRFV